jgi:hypothetical protein
MSTSIKAKTGNRHKPVKTGGKQAAKQTMPKPDRKKPKPASSAKASGEQKLSAIDAAAKVLTEAGQPMNTKEMVEAMATKGYWSSPAGKTPHATLYTVVTMLPNLAP